MSTIKNLIILSLIILVGSFAQARDSRESMLLLKEALMESNGDYNIHKKKFNHEEFDRADEWAERNTQAITINERKALDKSWEEFKQQQDVIGSGDREVSSNETFNHKDKWED